MNGCTINSKDHCRESRAHGVAKIYYLHKLLYQNIRSFLLNDILVILVKNILVRSTTTVGGSVAGDEAPDLPTPRRKRAFPCRRERPTSLSSLSSPPPSFEGRPPTPALVSYPRASRSLPSIFLSLLCIPSTVPPAIIGDSLEQSSLAAPVERVEEKKKPRYVRKPPANPRRFARPWRLCSIYWTSFVL